LILLSISYLRNKEANLLFKRHLVQLKSKRLRRKMNLMKMKHLKRSRERKISLKTKEMKMKKKKMRKRLLNLKSKI
jgi:hypothetical protein